MPLKQISPFFSYWRVSTALDREVVDAVIAAGHEGPSQGLRDALGSWPGTYYWSRREGPKRVILIRALRPRTADRWWLHLLLFVLTFGTVWLAAAEL